MLLEGIMDSVLRRYGIGSPSKEEQEEVGRVVVRRLHELRDQDRPSPTPSSENEVGGD